MDLTTWILNKLNMDKINKAQADTQEAVSTVSNLASTIDTKISGKANKTDVDTAIRNMGSASPKGTYATLSALQTAFPTGTTGIYVVTADGKWYYWSGTAWTAGGAYQSTGIGDKSIKPEHLAFVGIGKNLVDPSKLTHGYYLGGTGGMNASALYSTTDFIAVKAGEPVVALPKIRISLLYDASKNPVAGTYMNTATTGSYTVTPAQDGFVRMCFFKEDVDAGTLQIEKGTSPTSFAPYGVAFDESIALSSTQKKQVEKYLQDNNPVQADVRVSKEGNKLSITSKLSGGESIELLSFTDTSLNGSYRMSKTIVDGVEVHNGQDDITPIRMFSTVGANHMYAVASNVTAPGHGKTSVDSGSKWTDGTTTYTLVAVSGDVVTMAPQYAMVDGVPTAAITHPVGGKLTHVSGATNKGDITVVSAISGDMGMSTNKKSLKLMIDGQEITQDGIYYGKEFQVIEQYNIMDYKEILDFLQANIGKTFVGREDIGGIVKMSIVYTYTKEGKCLVSHGLKALKKVYLASCGFLQSVALSSSGYTLKRYLPGILPKNGYDFKTLVDMTNYASSLLFYQSNFIDQNKPPNRYVDWLFDGSGKKKCGFTMGYVIDKTNSKTSDRLSQVGGNYYWDLRDTKKSYPVAINGITLNAGEYKTFLGYRTYMSPTDATNINIVEDKKDTYIYIDYHQKVSAKSIPLPKHIGKDISILDSSGVTVLNDVVDAEGVTFTVTADYGYAVLKIR